MRGKQFAALQDILNDRRITREEDRDFLYGLENALLLALLEDGTLTQMQCRQASEKLRRQRRDEHKPKGSLYTREAIRKETP